LEKVDSKDKKKESSVDKKNDESNPTELKD
jgi:hypothetical protein